MTPAVHEITAMLRTEGVGAAGVAVDEEQRQRQHDTTWLTT